MSFLTNLEKLLVVLSTANEEPSSLSVASYLKPEMLTVIKRI